MTMITRRAALQAGFGTGALAILGACTSQPTTDQRRSANQPPQRGGVLRVGALGQSSKLEQDPHKVISNDSDFMILSLIYDALTVPGAKPTVMPRLASKWTANDKVTKWRFEIAPNARFHDGSPVSSSDVAWSLQRLFGIGGVSRVPVKSASDIAVDGPNAITVTTQDPNSIVPLLLRLNTFTVKKGNTDFTKPIGTGPFKLASYSSGNARLVRNDAWHGGAPLLDAIEITRFDDAQSMTNAVLRGQIDLASNAGAIAARSAAGRSDLSVLRRPNDLVVPIVMRCSDGPFANPKVRQAIRLAADRPQLVKVGTSGYGTVANDILGTGDPSYDKSLPQRQRDIATAKALLAESGFDTRRQYVLNTKREAVGEVELAQLFATQMKDIGLSMRVDIQEVNAFYDKIWLKAPLYTTSWGTNDSLLFFGYTIMSSSSSRNESGFKDTEFDKAVKAGLAASDPAAYQSATAKMQQIQYDHGGYVAWGVADGLDIGSTHVQGLPTLPGFGRMQLEKAWMSK